MSNHKDHPSETLSSKTSFFPTWHIWITPRYKRISYQRDIPVLLLTSSPKSLHRKYHHVYITQPPRLNDQTPHSLQRPRLLPHHIHINSAGVRIPYDESRPIPCRDDDCSKICLFRGDMPQLDDVTPRFCVRLDYRCSRELFGGSLERGKRINEKNTFMSWGRLCKMLM